MKTWEMVKMFTENPNLRFKSKTDGSILALYKDIMFWDGDLSLVPELNIFEEWELIRESIPWQKALQALIDGKTIKCIADKCDYIYGNKEYIFKPSNTDAYHRIGLEHLKNGKWFIED